MQFAFSLTDFSQSGVAMTPGLTEIICIFLRVSTARALKIMSSARFEAQYGEINGKSQNLPLNLY